MPMKTSVAETLPYIDFCNRVMNDPSGELLKNFRRNADYDLVVPGNRDGEGVREFLNLIKSNYPEMLQFMPIFEKQQGVFGNPTTYQYDVGNFDSVILLYVFYLALTRRYFGNLNGMEICEIGPGAGLMFKLITDLYPDVKYTFIDLPGPLYINQKHVEYLGREKSVKEYLSCDTILSTEIDRHYDLVISDCAFNEITKEVQEVYIKKIINKSDRGRLAFYDAEFNCGEVKPMNIHSAYALIEKASKIIIMDLRVPTIYWNEAK
jgi:hypothetical protein